MQENYVYVNGREVPSAIYYKQRLLEIMSADAKIVLAWLRKKGKQVVSTVELTKCLTPLRLRHAKTVKGLMFELTRLGCVAVNTKSITYSGRKRKETWMILVGTVPITS